MTTTSLTPVQIFRNNHIRDEATKKPYTCISRWEFLAYAYMRGKAYRTVEPTARDWLDPKSNVGSWNATYMKRRIVDAIHEATAASEGRTEPRVPRAEEREARVAALEAWLAAPEPESHKTRRLAKEAAAEAYRASNRASHPRHRAA